MTTRLTLHVVLLASLLLNGCQTLSGLLAPEPSQPETVEAPVSQPYIELLNRLVNGDEQAQVQLAHAAHDAWTADPAPQNQLRYALVLATPGHADSDSLEAQRLFSQLLADPKGLRHEELQIARVFMAYAQQWQQLQAGYGELSWKLAELQAGERSRRDNQISALRQQVADLSRQLKEAEDKLNAIATIERQMERPDAEPGQE